MRIFTSFAFIIGIFLACGKKGEEEKKQNQEVEVLRQKIAQLQGTIDMIDDFTTSDFTECSTNLPLFEQKVCKIAQTATAEQRVEFASQLAEVSKVFQNSLYGEDCMDGSSPGCPVTGSVLSSLQTLEIQNNANSLDITLLQTSVLSLQGDLSSINNRLDDFNGTGTSIEAVIGGIKTEVATLKARVDAIENTLENSVTLSAISICGDNSDSGPLYEAVLIDGNKQIITAYIIAGSKRGLGVFKQVGDAQGNLYKSTALNTKTCKFRVYEVNSELKICWKNTDRSASSSVIDTTCDFSGGFVNKLTTCTCK